MTEKQQIEKSTINYFISYYPGNSLHLIRTGDKPDFTLADKTSNKKIGAEVTTLFYDSGEARTLLGRSSSDGSGVMNSDEIIKQLNLRIQDKENKIKNYTKHDKFFLIILVASLIFDKSTFDRFEEDIIARSKYDEIWLILYNFKNQKWQDLKKLK